MRHPPQTNRYDGVISWMASSINFQSNGSHCHCGVSQTQWALLLTIGMRPGRWPNRQGKTVIMRASPLKNTADLNHCGLKCCGFALQSANSWSHVLLLKIEYTGGLYRPC